MINSALRTAEPAASSTPRDLSILQFAELIHSTLENVSLRVDQVTARLMGHGIPLESKSNAGLPGAILSLNAALDLAERLGHQVSELEARIG